MGNLHKRKGAKWYRYQWTDARGKLRTRTMRGLTDMKLIRMVVAKIDSENAKEALGLVDPADKRRLREGARDVKEQIDAWEKKITAGNSKQYAGEEARLVRRVMNAAGFKSLSQIISGDVLTAIDRLPRARGKGMLGNRQKNKALVACKMFCEQMRRDGKIAVNPLLDLEGWDDQVDKRHQHVAYPLEHAAAIIEAAAKSDRTIEGLTGFQRSVLYRTARETGFRRRTLRELTPAHLHVKAMRPFVRILATNVKNKKQVDHPLSDDLAATLAGYIKGMAHDARLFPMSKRADTAAMMKHDVTAAGLSYEAGEYDFRDFHSWRNTFGTELGNTTDNIKVVQELMGHSTPVLTARYMRPTRADYHKAVNAIPKIEQAKPQKEQVG